MTQDTQDETDSVANLGAVIADGESKRGGYNAYNSGTGKGADGKQHVFHSGVKDLSKMTVDQILASSQNLKATDANRVFAAGKYQVITKTLLEAKAQMPLTGTELYTRELQEEIFMHFLITSKRPKIGAYVMRGVGTSDDAVYESAKEWASIEVPAGRRIGSGKVSDGRLSYYESGANHAKAKSGEKVKAALERARGAYLAAKSGNEPLPKPEPAVEPTETKAPQSEDGGGTVTVTVGEMTPIQPGHIIANSVGRGGHNHAADIGAVQQALASRGHSPGAVDHKLGPATIGAIEAFQHGFMRHPDGLVEVGHATETHLIDPSSKPGPEARKAPEANKESKTPKTEVPAKTEVHSANWQQVSRNFNAAISGSSLTWHDALWLPSFHRYTQPSDLEGADLDTILSNIERQAAALQQVSAHFGKQVHVHCWLRPPAYNRKIGGVSNSAHLRGTATDFDLPGLTAEHVRKELQANPAIYPGAGENNVTWLHLDLEHKRWFGKGK